MDKLFRLAQKLGATAATAATFCSNTVATLLPHGSSTVASHNGTLNWLFSRLKTPFNSLFGSNGSSTSPNFDLNPHFPDSWENGDEYDFDDYDDWYDAEAGYDDHRFDEILNKSWEQEAVDEAIDEEEPGQYPPTFTDDPNPWDGLFGKNRF